MPTRGRVSLRHRLENITTLAGLQQDGDTFSKVQAQGDVYFQAIHAKNLQIKLSEPELIFVYTMRKNEEGIHFVVDAGLPNEPDISMYGDTYLEPSQTLIDNFDNMTATIVEPEIYEDEFGAFLSEYTPIFASDGTKVGVLGVDISADTIIARERDFLIRLIPIYLGTLIFIVLVGILAADLLAKPIVRLRDAANKISAGDFSYRISNIPETRELAELAVDFNAMTANLSSLITDLERRVSERTEDITKKTEPLRAASYIARQTAEIQDLSLTQIFADKTGDGGTDSGPQIRATFRHDHAAAAAGATRAMYVTLRLPLEIRDLFEEWLKQERPDRAARVMSLVRQTRGGKDYDSRWGARMRGTGPVAELVGARFAVACRRLGLNRERPQPDTALFRKPPEPGDQMDLFGWASA